MLLLISSIVTHANQLRPISIRFLLLAAEKTTKGVPLNLYIHSPTIEGYRYQQSVKSTLWNFVTSLCVFVKPLFEQLIKGEEKLKMFCW
jgi:hypothetical protein